MNAVLPDSASGLLDSIWRIDSLLNVSQPLRASSAFASLANCYPGIRAKETRGMTRQGSGSRNPAFITSSAYLHFPSPSRGSITAHNASQYRVAMTSDFIKLHVNVQMLLRRCIALSRDDASFSSYTQKPNGQYHLIQIFQRRSAAPRNFSCQKKKKNTQIPSCPR